MTKWEHTIVHLTCDRWRVTGYMNEKGAEGWELVSMTKTDCGDHSAKCEMVFKRPLEEALAPGLEAPR